MVWFWGRISWLTETEAVSVLVAFSRSVIQQRAPIRSGDCGRDGEKASSQLRQIKENPGKPYVHNNTHSNCLWIDSKGKREWADTCTGWDENSLSVRLQAVDLITALIYNIPPGTESLSRVKAVQSAPVMLYQGCAAAWFHESADPSAVGGPVPALPVQGPW